MCVCVCVCMCVCVCVHACACVCRVCVVCVWVQLFMCHVFVCASGAYVHVCVSECASICTYNACVMNLMDPFPLSSSLAPLLPHLPLLQLVAHTTTRESSREWL